jgi:hypothetical protein
MPVRPGDVITADLLNRIMERQSAPGLRIDGGSGLSGRQTSDGQIQIWNDPGTQGAFICQPSSDVLGASGTWPDITPVSFVADVYQTSGSTKILVMSSATIYNWYASGLSANQTVRVTPDGSGAYVADAQSCI